MRVQRMTVTLFIPCFIDALYPRAGMSVVQILERLGHKVVCPEEIACCGQPAFNSGYWAEAARRRRQGAGTSQGRRNGRHRLRFLRRDGQKVLSATVCRTRRRRNWPDRSPTRIWEFSDFLVTKLGVTDLGARFPAKVTFHDGCHGLRELGIKKQPRALLAKVRDLQLIEMSEAETCCGFGGTFSAKFPMISTAMGEVKCASAIETGADYIVSNDLSCLMHQQGLLSRQGSKLKTIHLAEVLTANEF